MSKLLSYPLSAVLSLTNNCNLNCLHCFNSSSKTYDTDDEYQRWKKIIPILAEKRVFNVRYSGGEPLSVPWFQSIAEEVASFKINSGLNTNATYITSDIAKWIKKLPMRRDIIVGIDGLKNSHEELRGYGTYDRSIRGLQFLINEDLKTIMFCVITKLNYNEIS